MISVRTDQRDKAEHIDRRPAIALLAAFQRQRRDILLEFMMETIDPLHFVPVAIRQRTEILRGRIADSDHAIDTDDDRRDEQDHADRHDDGKDRHQEEQQEEHHRADIELLHQIDEQQHAVQRGCADHRTDQPRHAQQRPDRFPPASS